MRQWPEGGPRLLWTVESLGEGYSTPSLAGGRLFVMGNRDGSEWVFALDPAADGKKLWAARVGSVRHEGGRYPGPRSTPTVDAARVYALGMNGDVVCLDAADGAILWRRDLVNDFGGRVQRWGYSESLLVDGPWVLCTPGGDDAMIAALDKLNGNTVWQSPRGGRAGYASIVKATIDGVEQYVQFMADGVVAVEADGGKPLWRYDAPANRTANVATPIVEGDSVFAASAYGTGGGRVDLKRTAGNFDVREVYFTRRMQNHHGGVILIDGYLYGASNPGILTCIDWESGEIAWQDRKPGKCSLLYIDGMLIARSEDALVSLVAARPDRFELLGQFREPQSTGAPTWPHPVVSDGRLYLRDHDVLYCYDVHGTRAD